MQILQLLKVVDLQCFADTHSDGNSAVRYICVDDGQGCSRSFVIGKSRVAPAIKQTTPRMELCSAVVAVRLSRVVEQEYGLSFDRILFWLDSMTVLSYFKTT